MAETMLTIENLDVVYDKTIRALGDVSLEVNRGEIVAVLGSNGAGKTTLMKSISGLVKPVKGSIKIKGMELVGIPAHKVLGYGIAHVPEGRMIVPSFTVRENLMVGAHIAPKSTIEENMEKVMELFPILKDRIKQPAGTMSGGEQQMLVIGRALMSSPQVLLLDEPSLGLAPVLVEKVMEMVKRINETQGITIVLVEQNANLALELADRAYVLESGNITLSGAADVLMDNEELKKKYLAG